MAVTVRLGSRVSVTVTDRRDGDMRILRRDPGKLPGVPVSCLHQVHGSRVHMVAAGEMTAEMEGDALVSCDRDARLAVLTADCAPVALASDEGVFGVLHCGWRGTAAGIVSSAVARMRGRGAGPIWAFVGPCIGAECYEFGEGDLDKVASATGYDARAVASTGQCVLDLRRLVMTMLSNCGVTVAAVDPRCTACDVNLFSARARNDVERMACIVEWCDDGGDGGRGGRLGPATSTT